VDLTKLKNKRIKRHNRRRQGWEEGERNMKKSEDRRLMRRRWRNPGRGERRKRKGMRPKGRE